MTQPTEEIRLGPDRADRRLVLLHGWGADASDLLDLGELLVGPEVSVVALQAPLPHPSGQGRQWYDLQEPNWPQLPGAREHLRTRLQHLHDDIPLPQTVLLGFSQGAALGLDVATSQGGLALAGLISCSGYPHPGWQPVSVNAEGQFPILLTHGEQDPVVPYAASLELERVLSQAGRTVERIGFSGGHTIETSLLARMKTFLSAAWSSSS